ncbi:MAG: tRNA (adenosine(37)-N6)-threonylcarbamoyltransferase complex ATPase subunit type 1 TsaE [Bacteroidaceae bacterium]|nr:tRNA (adenosine(37)-N6)-threonylcarbamoyltransferase complex ATPase subunit type 1 TsaE [Bacteroidaceae bacterium]
MTLRIPTPADLPAAATEFVRQTSGHTVFAFKATMGAGKTTFIAAVCKALDVADTVTSPTFAVINEYRREPTGTPVYHFDFYRVKNAEEARDMGAEDYFYSGMPCFVEWPDIAADLLPDDTIYIYIDVEPDGTRNLTMRFPDDRT